MAKDNEFVTILQNSVQDGVLDKRSELEIKRDDLKKAIAELEANVIKDPKALENLKKELQAVEKKIKNEQEEKAVEKGDVVGEDATEKDTDEDVKKEEEKEEEIKDEKSLNDNEKAKEDAEKLKQTYHDAMIALYNHKLETIRRTKSDGKLISSKEDYEQELKLEAAMYEARDAYLKTGAEDPFTKKRTELIQQEKNAKEPIELELRERARKYRLLEEELRKLDKEQQEINERLLSPNLTDEESKDLNLRMQELGEERERVETKLATIKADLEPVMRERQQRAAARLTLDSKHVDTLTYEDKKNYDYQMSKVATMNSNFNQAEKLEYQNVKLRIEEREDKIKQINKELNSVPDTDFERRLELLNELDKETNMLEADRVAKANLDRGVKPTKEEMLKDASEKTDNEEYRQEEFDKATKEAREVIEQQDEKIGQAVVETPEVSNVEERDREASAIAATYAIAHDSPVPGNDNIVQEYFQYGAAKEVAKCVIPGLEDKVKTIDDTEEGKKNAEEYLKQDKEIREADHELDRIEEQLTKQ